MNSEKTKKRILISGGFDPIHPGHIAMIEAAAAYGEVHIALNSDEWLIRKKGFYFQPWTDRKKILTAYTDHIHAVDDSDGTVCQALSATKPDYFGNGGDRGLNNTPELDLCQQLGVEPVFELGGGKYASSSIVNGRQRVKTRWGFYDVVLDLPNLKVKVLNLNPGKTLSLQRHHKRSEFFFMPNGEVRINLPGVWHSIQAPPDEELSVVEVQVGESEESDLEKISETDESFSVELGKKVLLNREFGDN